MNGIAGRGIAATLENVLAALVRLKSSSVPSGDQNLVEIVADDEVVQRLSFAHVDFRRLLRGDVVAKKSAMGIGRARLWIGLTSTLLCTLV